MEYETTKTNSIFKEGIKVKMAYAIDTNLYSVHTSIIKKACIYVCQELLDKLINDKYIKEVEQLEFTKSDMMGFALFHTENRGCKNNTLNEWLKLKNK